MKFSHVFFDVGGETLLLDWGPANADELIARDGASWRTP
jgi:hypothetical protein